MTGRALTPAPQLLIVLPLEAAPYVVCDWDTDEDCRRLEDWIGAHPELRDIVDQAREFAAGRRAA